MYIFEVEVRSVVTRMREGENMSYSISISAIFTTSSVKMTPRGGARPSTRSSPQIACATSPEASTVAATKSIASRARSRLLTLTFDINPWPGPRNWAMAGGSNGYLAAPVRRQLTPGLISSLPGTAELPPFISFSTSYGELDSAVRRPMPRIGKRRREYFAVGV